MSNFADPIIVIDRRWTAPVGSLAIGLVAILTAFVDTWRAMADIWWTSDTFGHGILVAPISAWLIWRQRDRLSTLVPQPSWTGTALLALGCVGWLVAELAGVDVVAQFAVVAMLPALVLAALGWQIAWSLAFPLVFLLFMVPAGEVLNPPLMEWTADATVWAVAATGIPVFREGLHFTLPTGRWSVVEACSGLRYVLASAVLASLFAHLNFQGFRKKALFVGVALVLAVLANWIRAYLIVIVGHLSDMRLAVGDDHVVYGWVFYGVVMLTVFALGMRWRDDDGVDPRQGSQFDARCPADSAVPIGAAVAFAPALAGVTLVVIAVGVLGTLRDVDVRSDLSMQAAAILGPYAEAEPAMKPRFAGARQVVQGRLDADGAVDFYVAYFARQSDGAEMIAFGNGVRADAAGWMTLSQQHRITSAAGAPIAIREWRVRSGGAQRLIWSWYTVGGLHAISDYRAKALTAWSMLRGGGDHSVVAVLSVELEGLASTPSDAEVARAQYAAHKRLEAAADPVRRLAEALTVR